MRAVVLVIGLSLTAIPDARSQSRMWVVPAVSLNVSHDTNLFLGPGSAGDTLTQLRPAFEGAYESPNREFYGAAAFEAQVSAQYPSLTMLGARRNALIDARVKTTPRVFIGLGGRYDRTDSPSELNLESGVLLGRTKATRAQVTPSASYRATPRATLTAQYDGLTESLSGYAQQSLHAARVGMDYARSPRTQWGGRYIARSFVGAPFDSQHSHTVLLSWTRQVAPGSNLSLQLGPRISSYRGPSPEVLASYLRQYPRQRFLIDYWHGETIVLGVPGPVAIHSGSNRMSWLVGNDLEVSTLLGVFRSVSLNDRRALVYHGGVGGAWAFRPRYTLTVTYRADFQRGDLRGLLPADGEVTRGVFLAGVTIAPRLTRTFKPFRPPGREPALPMTGVLWP